MKNWTDFSFRMFSYSWVNRIFVHFFQIWILREKLIQQFSSLVRLSFLFIQPWTSSLECEFFIDYRSTQTGCDRSLRLGHELKTKYGAKIVEVPNASSTTHIIFKNGTYQSKLFARKYNLPLIDLLWLEECINKRRVVGYKKNLVDIGDLENQQQQPLPTG